MPQAGENYGFVLSNFQRPSSGGIIGQFEVVAADPTDVSIYQNQATWG